MASMEPFFAHMSACVGEPIAAVNVSPKDQAALVAWNSVFREGSDVKGGSAGTFPQVYHKAKAVAMGALVLRRRWNRCLKMACVPNTAQQTISCQSLYFSYNPHKHACMPQKGFCHQSMNHFGTLEDCSLACIVLAETGRAAFPKPQDTEIRLSILRKKNGVSATLVNSTLKVPPKKSLFFVGYLLPDPYGPLKGIVKSGTQSQGHVANAPNTRPEDNNSHPSQITSKQPTQTSNDTLAGASRTPFVPAEATAQFPEQAHGLLGLGPVERKKPGMEIRPQKLPETGSPMNAPPPGLWGTAGAPTNSPKPPRPEEFEVAKTFSSQATTKAIYKKNVLPALPIGPAVSEAQGKELGTLPSQPLSSGNNVLQGPPISLPSGAVGVQVPPIEGHLAMPASLPGVISAEELSAKQFSEVPQQPPTLNALGRLGKEQVKEASTRLYPPTPSSSSEDSAEAAHRDISTEQEASSAEQDSNSSVAVGDGTEQHAGLMQPSESDEAKARKERSAPPSEGKLPGRVEREQPRWAVPLSRHALSRLDAVAVRSERARPVVEEKVSMDRAPHTGVGTPFAMRRSFAEPLTAAANRRQRRSGRRAARWAHRRGPSLPSSISV